MKKSHLHSNYLPALLILGTVFLIFLTILFSRDFLPKQKHWKFQSIDTMKYSRDLAREKMYDKAFESIIDLQVENISKTGATHIGIATPYDQEFLPFLKKWVTTSRKYGLKIWYRGNFSGWEGWFDYPKISRDEHLQKTVQFLNENPDLFVDGDVFTACPECENGGPGDPRFNGDVEGHRAFLIEEYQIVSQLFRNQNKKIATNYNSMNYDVAKITMDRMTTQRLGGVVAIDHYVKTPENLIHDIDELANLTGGKIILGEYGVPIPDINGEMSEDEQATWIQNLLTHLTDNNNIIGLNYWVNEGGSTELWQGGKAKKAVSEISQFYTSVKDK